MKERLIVSLIATGICTITAYVFVAKPRIEQRRLRTAEEEAKILMKGKQLSASASVTSQTSTEAK